jgi:methyltransferase family protein
MAGADDYLASGAWRGTVSREELWARLLAHRQPRTALEIGVWRGAFTAHLLRAATSIERCFMIDPWRPLEAWNKPCNVSSSTFEAAYADALASTDFAADRRRILRGRTVDVVDQIDDASLDFIYVDGDHTLRGISIDLIASWPKLASGGWLGGDDFAASVWQHGARFEPTLVFPFAAYFAEAVGARLWALPFDQFLIEKPPPGVRDFAVVDLVGGYAERSLLPQLTGWRAIGRALSAMLRRS